ncbi:phospholipid phosphatase 5-like [Tubulanus polymorphus]|uniref:phospholipid phosphatase 5-like n=1 Tax=Tubulanus polymorphus TaxID=672921 RepID=UPI003DA5BA50
MSHILCRGGDSNRNNPIYSEIIIRFCLLFVFIATEFLEPVKRVIQPEEWWLYRNPTTPSYVSAFHLWILVCSIPSIVIVCWTLKSRNLNDCFQACLAASLGLLLNGIITNCIKLIAGRPRPDFFYRCFPDGVLKKSSNGLYLFNEICTGSRRMLNEGRKSFPSGHSSFAFATFGFVTLFLAGKLRIFHREGRRNSLRLIAVILPLLIATIIALSRTIDYHHHWQDVMVGSILGSVIMYLSYHHYYPTAFHSHCETPHCQPTRKKCDSDQQIV